MKGVLPAVEIMHRYNVELAAFVENGLCTMETMILTSI
jgi:hypothetical protein